MISKCQITSNEINRTLKVNIYFAEKKIEKVCTALQSS